MAAEGGIHPDTLALLDSLREQPGRFDLFQILRRLDTVDRSAPRLGEAAQPAEELVRLAQAPSLQFSPSVIVDIDPREIPVRIVTSILGLFGPHGPLPQHITEYVIGRSVQHHDRTLAAFADIFHHRMISLFYRAYANSQAAFERDRPEDDRFQKYVGSLVSLAPERPIGFAERARLYFAGRFALRPRSAEGLREIIADLFAVPTEIQESVGEWLDLSRSERWQLRAGAAGVRLDSKPVVGGRVWIQDGKFRVVLGPLGQQRYQSLLPGGASLKKLAAIVRSYVGDQFSWDLELILSAPERTPWRLRGGSARLGWDTRLGAYGRAPASVVVAPRQVSEE